MAVIKLSSENIVSYRYQMDLINAHALNDYAQIKRADKRF